MCPLFRGSSFKLYEWDLYSRLIPPKMAPIRIQECMFFHDNTVTFNFIGASHDRLVQEVSRFKEFKVQRMAHNLRIPQGDGVLVFDEVKVVCRLMWNSRSHQLVGLAMSHEELASLTDVYQLLDPEYRSNQTTYILQFLWRDLTSPFDVVGPYFTSSGPLESKFILSCVFESMKTFHLYGFKTYALVCDAAAPNVSVLKATTGVHGAYGNSEVKPEFKNPFDIQQG